VLTGRATAAAAIGMLQGVVVLLFVPLVLSVTATQLAAATAALALAATTSGVLGLLVAAPLRSVENYAGIINVVLFPLLFLSGALYPTAGMPLALRVGARLNPVSYAVDLTRLALGQPAEFGAMRSIIVLGATTVLAFSLTAVIFDPEQRFILRNRVAKPAR
jgi:ABC-2 type transport system permease protein